MKKKLFLLCTCFMIFVLGNIKCNANQFDELNKVFKQAAEYAIQQNNQLAACSTSSDLIGTKVLGVSNGKCHFYAGSYGFADKEVPMFECFVPMNVLKQEIQKQNAKLASGVFSASTSDAPFAPYCTRLHGTITTDQGSFSY